MKKSIGIIGVVALAMTMFFNVNSSNALKGDLDLASLLEMNTANAEGCSYETMDSYCYWGNVCIIICNGTTTYGFGWSNSQ